MTTIHITTHSRLSPEQVLAAGYDFSARRTEIFHAVSIPHFEVHELGQTTADVTEGTPVGVGINWERCRYDWSQPGSVKAIVTDSNRLPTNEKQLGAPSRTGRKRKQDRDDLDPRIHSQRARADLRDPVQDDRKAHLHPRGQAYG